MTMRLTIKNEDETRTATIEVVDYYPVDEAGTSRSEPTLVEIPPGETREQWIHGGRKIVVRERA